MVVLVSIIWSGEKLFFFIVVILNIKIVLIVVLIK